MDSGHLAMTYTALATLVVLGDDFSRVDRISISKGFLSVFHRVHTVPCGSLLRLCSSFARTGWPFWAIPIRFEVRILLGVDLSSRRCSLVHRMGVDRTLLVRLLWGCMRKMMRRMDSG